MKWIIAIGFACVLNTILILWGREDACAATEPTSLSPFITPAHSWTGSFTTARRSNGLTWVFDFALSSTKDEDEADFLNPEP
jgi:hypothetical protein